MLEIAPSGQFEALGMGRSLLLASAVFRCSPDPSPAQSPPGQPAPDLAACLYPLP